MTKLSMEEVEKFKKGINHQGKYIYDLFDTIEAQQQEIEQLKAQARVNEISTYPFEKCKTCTFPSMHACTISADLKSCSNPQVNKKYKIAIVCCNPNELYFCQTGTPQDSVNYHNPDDVAALDKAREALTHKECTCYAGIECKMCQAIEAIDKAKGGDLNE